MRETLKYQKEYFLKKYKIGLVSLIQHEIKEEIFEKNV
jgi:hypothetical protein